LESRSASKFGDGVLCDDFLFEDHPCDELDLISPSVSSLLYLEE